MSKRPANVNLTKSPTSATSKKKKCSYVELQVASNACWTGLLTCQQCKSISHRFEKDKKFSWCLELFCDNCSTSFKICTVCPSNKTRFYTDAQLKKHRYLKSHTNNLKKEETHEKICTFEESSTSIKIPSTIANREALEFLTEKNLQYFIHHSYNQGIPFLFANSYFPEDSQALEIVSESDAEFNILLGNFVYNLTGLMKVLFVEILQNLKAHMLPCVENTPDPYALRIPFLQSTLRSTYLDGKKSLIDNIPTPPISAHYSGKDGLTLHSYCSLIDCLTHFLAFGTGINNLFGKDVSIHRGSTVDHLSDTRTANNARISMLEDIRNKTRNTREEKHFVFTFLTTFSDAFDPTVSLVKANRHGVWVYQICFLKTKESKEYENTYVLAIGDKSDDHSEVVEKIEEEIDAVRSGRCPLLFDGRTKRMVQPIVSPLLRHADQPERRELYGLKLGKGSNHARWRYSFDICTAKVVLPSCETCREVINQSCLRNRPIFAKCSICANWEFNHDLMKWSKPKYYPNEMIDKDGYLRPLRLSTSLLILVCKLTHEKVSKGKWNSSTANSFLSRFCISTKLSESIIDNALNVRLLDNLENVSHQSFEALKKDKINNPSKYMLAKLPPLWYGKDDIHSYPDSPMHLLSGIVKSTLKLSFKSMKQNNQYSHFMKLMGDDDTMSSIVKLKIPWFRLIPIKSEKFPGMGSEIF